MSTTIDHACKLLTTLPAGSIYWGAVGIKGLSCNFGDGPANDGGAALLAAQEEMRVLHEYEEDRTPVNQLLRFHVDCGGLEMSILVVTPGATFQARAERYGCDDVGSSLTQALNDRRASVKLLEALVAWGMP